MIKRIIVLLTVAAAMGATVALTASGAVAQEVVVPPPLQAFCDAQLPKGTTSSPPPTCTYTKTTTEEGQHGFTRSTSQEFTLTISQLNVDDPESSVGTEVGEPIVSCQNRQGKDVSPRNPNCTPAP